MVTNEDAPGEGMTWDGYTDYQQVAGRVASECQDAIAAASMLQRVDLNRAEASPREVAESESRILSAALLLESQLDEYGGPDDDYDEILAAWQGDDGYIKKFRQTDFYSDGVPEWLFDFVSQINVAGLRLGYLQAGRKEEIIDSGDAEDSEVQEIIEEMTL